MAKRPEGKRVLIYDGSQVGMGTNQLSLIWGAGSRLVGGFDCRIRANTWENACDLLAEYRLREPWIAHVQHWGHGAPGRPKIGSTTVDLEDLADAARLEPDAVVWWRCCETFEGRQGQAFAVNVTRILKCANVGHTMVISGREDGSFSPATLLYQSGCYGLRPGELPHWPIDEHGGSRRRAPNTVSLLARNPPAFVWQPRTV